MLNVSLAVLGGIILVLGWRVFWLFVGVVGFAAGLQAAQLVFGPHPFWVLWVAGLIGGVIGAILALFFQKLAIGVGGFVAGSTIVLHLTLMMGMDAGAPLALIGGLVGAVALYLLFDWALIILSSVVGATFIVEAFGRQAPYTPALAVILFVAGIICQTRALIISRKGDR